MTLNHSSVTQSHFCWHLALATHLAEAGKVTLLTHFPMFCPCVTDPSKKTKKDLVAPITINKPSLLRRNLATSPSEQNSNIVCLFFIYKEMKCPANTVGHSGKQTMY